MAPSNHPFLRIEEIPTLPPEIISAYKQKKLLLFVGAGISQIIECAGWYELAASMIKRCRESKNGAGERLLSARDVESLKLAGDDHRKKISVCKRLLVEVGQEEIYYEELNRALRVGYTPPSGNIYEIIRKLDVPIITTNADPHLDRFYEEDRIYVGIPEASWPIESTRLAKVHGSIGDGTPQTRKTLVFTVSEYFSTYRTLNKEQEQFLSDLFTEYTVIFLGYGLADNEILEHLFSKIPEAPGHNHFLLQPYWREDYSNYKIDHSYYDSMGITVIPFERDNNDYAQQGAIIEEWQSQLIGIESPLMRHRDQIAKALPERDTSYLFTLARSNQSLWRELCIQIEKASQDSLWCSTEGHFWLEQFDKRDFFSQAHDNRFWLAFRAAESIASNGNLHSAPQLQAYFSEFLIRAFERRTSQPVTLNVWYELIRILTSLTGAFLTEVHLSLLEDLIQNRDARDHFLYTNSIKKVWQSAKQAGMTGRLLGAMFNLHLQRTDHAYDFDTAGCHALHELQPVLDASDIDPLIITIKTHLMHINNVSSGDVVEMWIEVFYNAPDTWRNNYCVEAIMVLRDVLLRIDAPDKYVRALLQQPEVVLRRLAVYVVAMRFAELRARMTGLENTIFADTRFWNECKLLLRTNAAKFSADEARSFIQAITALAVKEREGDTDYAIRLLNIKKEFLAFFKETPHEQLAAKAAKDLGVESLTDVEPPEDNRLRIYDVEREPRFRLSDEAENWNAELLEHESMKKGNSKEEAIEVGNRAVSEKVKGTQTYLDNPAVFQLPLQYRESVVRGLNKLIKDAKDDNGYQILVKHWSDVIRQTTDIMTLSHGHKILSHYGRDFGSLVTDVIGQQAVEIPSTLLQEAVVVLSELARKTDDRKEQSLDHLIGAYLNDDKTVVIRALLNCVFVLKHRGFDSEWQDVKAFLAKQSDDSARSAVFVVLGMNLPRLFDTETEWTTRILTDIANRNDDSWQIVLASYIQSMRVHEQVHVQLDRIGILARGFDYFGVKSRVREALIKHITYAFLNEFSASDRMMSRVLIRGEIEDLDAVSDQARFNKSESRVEERVRVILQGLYRLRQSSDAYRSTNADAVLWFAHLSNWDEEAISWLRSIAIDSNTVPSSMRLIQLLANAVKDHPMQVADAMIVHLRDVKFNPYYPEEQNEQIIQTLIDKGYEAEAKNICLRFMELGESRFFDRFFGPRSG